jgi:hypothetical protein
MDRNREWRRFDFQSRKFKELMLYFSKRGQEEGLVIGSTKLNKLMFFADFRAFEQTGVPITGARYQKLEWGPAARELLPMRNELLRDEEARLVQEGKADVLVPASGGDVRRSVLSDTDRRIADEIFEELRPYNAIAASDYSHLKSAGWNVVELHEDIPYESAFVITDPPPAEAIALGRELASKYGW